MTGEIEIDDSGPPKLAVQLEEFLSFYVKGQKRAINAVCRHYGYSIALGGLEAQRGPIASLLFLGPSRVGKTEMARALARFFHHSENAMVKIDCSQFQERHQVASLIGSPHGYVGYGDTALLSPKNIAESKQKKTEPAGESEAETADQGPDAEVKKVITELVQEMGVLRIEVKDIWNEWRVYSGVLDAMERLDVMLKDAWKISGVDTNKIEKNLRDSYEKEIVLQNIILEMVSKLIKCRNRLEYIATQLMVHKQTIKRKVNSGGNLGAKVKTTSASYPAIILWDEIEKAHDSVNGLMLQVLDDGRITMSNGEVSDLRNTIHIITSNVGSREITQALKGRGNIGFHTVELADLDRGVYTIGMDELKKRFKQEFLNRLDGIVAFRHLGRDDLFAILDKEIGLFNKSLKGRQVSLTLEDDVKELVVQESSDEPEAGAGLLQHKFKSMIKIPLANILHTKLASFAGDVTAFLDTDKKKIKFRFRKTKLITDKTP